MICKKKNKFDIWVKSYGHGWIRLDWIGNKPRLPMVKKRLMAKGIITRMESRIKNKENCQFKSRALVQNLKKCQRMSAIFESFTHVAEKMSNA